MWYLPTGGAGFAVIEWVEGVVPHKRKEVIGNCTLYLGDCRDILPTLDRVDAVVTDPPYNVGKNYGTHKDCMEDGDYENLLKEVERVCHWQAWLVAKKYLALFASTLNTVHPVVVQRGAQGPCRWGFFDQHQLILVRGKPIIKIRDHWSDIRLTGEGYFFREVTYNHPGYTPLPIMDRLCGMTPAGVICDPFLGTGTTGVACAKMGRSFIGIEIDEGYFDIACQRIEDAYRQGDMFVEKSC